MKAIVNTQAPELKKLNGKTFEIKTTSMEGVTLLVNNELVYFQHGEIFIVDVELEIHNHYRWINGFGTKCTDEQISALLGTMQNLKKHCAINNISIFE